MHVFLGSQHVSLTVYNDYPLLVSATLLGVGRQGGCSSCFSPSKTGTFGFPPVIVYLYKVYINTLDIVFAGLSAVSNLYINLISPLRSWGPSYHSRRLLHYRGGAGSCWQISNSSHASCMVCPIQLPWGSPLFSLGLISTRSSIVGLLGLFIPYSTWFLGVLQSSCKYCFNLVSGFPGSLLPAFYYFRPLKKKIFTGWFPSLWRYF